MESQMDLQIFCDEELFFPIFPFDLKIYLYQFYNIIPNHVFQCLRGLMLSLIGIGMIQHDFSLLMFFLPVCVFLLVNYFAHISKPLEA